MITITICIFWYIMPSSRVTVKCGARGKKLTFSDTSYSLSLIRGPVATVGSVGVEGAEGGEERKELVLKD
jgi:hypothetical protein